MDYCAFTIDPEQLCDNNFTADEGDDYSDVARHFPSKHAWVVTMDRERWQLSDCAIFILQNTLNASFLAFFLYTSTWVSKTLTWNLFTISSLTSTVAFPNGVQFQGCGTVLGPGRFNKCHSDFRDQFF
jgi:hypothetical protein